MNESNMESGMSPEDVGFVLSGKAEKLESGGNGDVIREIARTIGNLPSVRSRNRIKSQGRVSFGRPVADMDGRAILIPDDAEVVVTDEFITDLAGAATRLTDSSDADPEAIIHDLLNELGSLSGVHLVDRSTTVDGRIHFGDVDAVTGIALFHPENPENGGGA